MKTLTTILGGLLAFCGVGLVVWSLVGALATVVGAILSVALDAALVAVLLLGIAGVMGVVL